MRRPPGLRLVNEFEGLATTLSGGAGRGGREFALVALEEELAEGD